MVEFYRDTLGLALDYQDPGELAFFRLGATGKPYLVLVRSDLGEQGPDDRILLALDVEDLLASSQALSERGISMGPLRHVPHGRAAIFRDPEMNQIELHQPD